MLLFFVLKGWLQVKSNKFAKAFSYRFASVILTGMLLAALGLMAIGLNFIYSFL